MQVQFNNQKPFTLVTHSCTASQTSAKCRILYDGIEQPLFEVILKSQSKHSPHEPAVKLAFAMAAKIANELFDLNINADIFSLPQGAHMVKIGHDYHSWGTDAEKTKTRVKCNLKDNDISGFEFYLRHTLLAIENQSYDRKVQRKRMLCL